MHPAPLRSPTRARSLSVPLALGLALAGCEFNRDGSHPTPPGTIPSSGSPVLPGHEVQIASRHLPAWSGGTLHLVADRYAVIADADRDQVHVVDVETRALLHHIQLQPGDEPGRLAHDPEGRVYVALRRGGAVAVLDPVAGALLSRVSVCPAPRGLAYDEARERLVIACADGTLAFWAPATGALQRQRLELDLRDVVVLREGLAVSRFRSAEILLLDLEGRVQRRTRPPGSFDASAGVAWRMVASPTADHVVVLHQLAQDTEVSIQPGGYGGFGCSVVSSALTEVGADGVARGQIGLGTTLAMDLSVSASGGFTAVTPAEMEGRRPSTVSGELDELPEGGAAQLCDFGDPSLRPGFEPGSFVAVAHRADGSAIKLSQDPPVLHVGGRVIAFAEDRLVDTGQKLFHLNAGGGVACASCHPEGGDDGHVWRFEAIGARRSQTIHGGLLGSEPFHWNGDMPSFQHLVSEVFQSRMGGGAMSAAQVGALSRWIDQIPSPPAPRSAADPEVEAGRVLFESAELGCASCHDGPRRGGVGAFDVGTGAVLEVPALVGVAYRAPFLHDGCAPTLLDRFVRCGGGDRHGKTSHLSEAQRLALVAYLESL